MIYSRRQFLKLTAISAAFPALLSACGRTSGVHTMASPTQQLVRPAFESGVYRNLFAERGKSEQEIATRIDAAWQSLFASTDDTRRVYYPAGENEHGPLAYIKDIGNDDIRSEGMSYGMMIAVQLDKQAEFDALWNWAKTYMQHQQGIWKGYFAWHNREDGSQIDQNPASDGEEWFATALLFAAGRWGNRVDRFNYQAEADAILNTMLHKTDMSAPHTGVTNMFDREQRQVVFVPWRDEATFTDPSYHLPAFYELWGRWAAGFEDQEADRQFWLAAAQTSRDFFQKTSHPTTGLTPDYANFDGSPKAVGGHDAFRFDAFRTIGNVAVDYAWFGADERERALCDRLQAFFASQGAYVNQYTLDGKPLSQDRSPGLIAMNAVASLAATDQARAAAFVDALWELQPPTGKWRYYDGLLYLLALLHVSGNFRIYAPKDY
ncbi:MAG TPA: glycosyl hydrolase family 8 [Herpetosiphonaceae bacterium]